MEFETDAMLQLRWAMTRSFPHDYDDYDLHDDNDDYDEDEKSSSISVFVNEPTAQQPLIETTRLSQAHVANPSRPFKTVPSIATV